MKAYIKNYCVGCGACKSLNQAELKKDKKGYLYPADGNQDWLEKICPAAGVHVASMSENSWGRKKAVYYGWSSDNLVRENASSGGVLTELAAFMLEQKLVDEVLHTCVDDQCPSKTKICYSTTRKQLVKRCGSRYSISHPLAELHKLDSKKRYLFIGKPCDVVALRNLQKIEPKWKEIIPYVFSFFCAGLPSVDAQHKLLTSLGTNKKDCVSLRYRGNGWPGYATAVDKNGDMYQMDYNTSWGTILGRDIMKGCRFCLDGIGEMADISCGDAWYLTADGKPDFRENKGRNIVFARTEKGYEILESAKLHGAVVLQETDEKEAHLNQIQKYQYERKATMGAKILAVRLAFHPAPKYSLRMLVQWKNNVSSKKRWQIFRGTLKRVIQGKI